MNPRIGISLGDVTGIGPEVTLKALASLGPNDASIRFYLVLRAAFGAFASVLVSPATRR